MNTPDFVTIEHAARKLHDDAVCRLLERAAHTVSAALRSILNVIGSAHPQGAPKRFA